MNIDIYDGLLFGLGFFISQGLLRILGLVFIAIMKGVCK